jgi:gliding motility-associated-like protein
MEFIDKNVTGTIYWNENNNNSNDSLFTATFAPMTVVGIFTDTFGCDQVATVQLTEYCEPTIIKMPNIFVPGGTFNPTFHPIEVNDDTYIDIVNNIVSSQFEVYNRWGLKVHQSNDVLPRWDGMYENREVSSGTYFWVYSYTDSSLKEYKLNGFVQVIQNR